MAYFEPFYLKDLIAGQPKKLLEEWVRHPYRVLPNVRYIILPTKYPDGVRLVPSIRPISFPCFSFQLSTYCFFLDERSVLCVSLQRAAFAVDDKHNSLYPQSTPMGYN